MARDRSRGQCVSCPEQSCLLEVKRNNAKAPLGLLQTSQSLMKRFLLLAKEGSLGREDSAVH